VVVIVLVAAASAYYLLQPVKQTTTVRLAVGSSALDLTHATMFTAANFGFWKNEGINTNFTLVTGGPLAVKALLAGQADIVSASSGAILGAILTSGPQSMRVILSTNVDTDFEVWTSTNIKSAADLKGATWAISAIGSSDYGVALQYLASVGFSKDDLKWVSIGSPGVRLPALIAGKADVTILTIGQGAVAAKSKNVWNLATVEQLSKVVSRPVQLIAVSQKFMDTNPDNVQRFLRGYLRAARSLSSNETLFNAMLEKMAPGVYDKDEVNYLRSKMVTFWPVNGGVSKNEVQVVIDYYYKYEAPTDRRETLSFFVEYAPLRTTLGAIGRSSSAWDTVDF